MAGYLFQPERALEHLALSPKGTMVGVETLDDVAVLHASGQQIREQDKHYTSGKKPLGDRSKELWNSLKVWLDAIEDEDLDLTTAEFHLVTNEILSKGLAFDLKQLEDTKEARLAFVARLRKAGRKPPKELKKIFNHVLAYSDEKLCNLISRIRVFDATSAVHGDALREVLHDHLHLPPAHADEIIQGLLGWVDDFVLKQIRQGKPAWLTRAAFDERYLRLLYRYQDIAFVRETEEALIAVGEEERAERMSRLFVKQLQWVGCPVDDDDIQILEAIDAHIRSGAEVARLSQLGIVSVGEFAAFDERLVKRWRGLQRLHVPNPIPHLENERQAIGRALLNQTLLHRELLAGQQTSEFYLTQGAYHRLADEPPQLGWHPHFKEIVKEWANEKNQQHAASH